MTKTNLAETKRVEEALDEDLNLQDKRTFFEGTVDSVDVDGVAWLSPRETRPPPLPGSSISIFSSFGVLRSSSPETSLSCPLAKLSLFGGGRKFSTVRFNRSPPFALIFSRISLGGGSLL